MTARSLCLLWNEQNLLSLHGFPRSRPSGNISSASLEVTGSTTSSRWLESKRGQRWMAMKGWATTGGDQHLISWGSWETYETHIPRPSHWRAPSGDFVPKHPSAIGWQLLPGGTNSWLFRVHHFFSKSFYSFGRKACGILRPQPEIEPTPPALEAWSLNPWTTREVPFGVSVNQSLSRVRLFVIPWTTACQASLSSSNSWSLLKFMSIELVMLFNHLILYHPFSFCLQSFPGMESLPESALCITWPKYWSFSFSISPSNEYSGLISFRNDWFDLLAVQGTLKSFLQPFLPLSLAGDDI